MALAHRLFSPPFKFGRAHKKSDAPEWQQFKKLFGFFCSFFSIFFFCCERRDFFLFGWKCVSRKTRAAVCAYKKKSREKLRQKNRLLFGVHVLDRVIRLRHRSISIRLWPSLVIISILLCDIFVFCDFCSLLSVCGLFVVGWWDACALAFTSYQSKTHWNGNLLSFTNALTYDVSQFESCLCAMALLCTMFMSIHFYDKHFGLFLLNVLIFQVVNVS